MRRYGLETADLIVPGQDAGLKLSLLPASAAAPDCRADITGLFWFSDQSGAFDTSAEAAYLLPEGGAGPVLGAAKLLGETCGKSINWTTAWTPMIGSGGAPGIWSDGADLVVYPLETTTPGILSVSAELDGVAFGPIALVLIRYVCYGYGSGSDCPTVSSITWENGSDTVSSSHSASWSHTGTIQGNFPEGTVFTWYFNWLGSPSNVPTFSGSGSSCTLSSPSDTGSGYISAILELPGCGPVSTGYLNFSVT